MSRTLHKLQFDATIGLVVALLLFTLLIRGDTIDVHALRLGLSFVGGAVFALLCLVTTGSKSQANP